MHNEEDWIIIEEDALGDAQSVVSIHSIVADDNTRSSLEVDYSNSAPETLDHDLIDVRESQPLVVHIIYHLGYIQRRLHYIKQRKGVESVDFVSMYNRSGNFLEFLGYIIRCLLHYFTARGGYYYPIYEWKSVKNTSILMYPVGIDPAFSRTCSLQLRAGRLIGCMHRPDVRGPSLLERIKWST